MATPIVLGLDIGGANLKAATADRQAVSMPFALWKQPDRLPAALAELLTRFPEVDEIAVTMTGELCDCFETKRDGVNAILTAVLNVSRSRPVRVWSTDGVFLNSEQARRDYLKVAAANWHALATFAGQYVPSGPATLIDIGTTTTDVIPLLDGIPIPKGKTDPERMAHEELVYMGVRRTPIMAIIGADECMAAELFATTLDVYLHLGLIAEDSADTDTADGRPATRAYAFDRLCRMCCGDRNTVTREQVDKLAQLVHSRHQDVIADAYRRSWQTITDSARASFRDLYLSPSQSRVILSGQGAFLLGTSGSVLNPCHEIISLADCLGTEVSTCAPAHAVAQLATESVQPRLPASETGHEPPGGRVTRGIWPWSRP